MRVVHIIKIVLTAGAERHLLRLLPGLITHGVDVRLIVLVQPDKPMDDFMALAAEANIPTERMTIYHHADLTLLPRLIARLHQLKPDIVHTHLLHADLYGVLAARLAGVQTIIMSRHNDNAFRYRVLIRLLNRILWGLSSGGIAISDAIRRFCIEIEGASPDKIHTVHYGLDLQKTPPSTNLRQLLNLPDNAFLFGTVSRLIEQKGLTYAIQAFTQIAPNYPKVYLLITGDGVLRDELQSQVNAAKLGERIIFLGWKENVSDIMAQLDVFLMPSLWEGFGLVLLEAMAHSLPIIATDVSAIPETVIHEETGFIIPPHDPDSVGMTMRRLIGNTQLRKKMGAAGHQRLKTHFSEAKMISSTLKVYQNA